MFDVPNVEIRNVIKSHSVRLWRDHREEISSIKKAITELISIDPSSSEVQCLRDRLNVLLTKYNFGVFIRSKVQDFNFDDKPSQYFFNKEKVRGKSKLIDKLIVKESAVCDFPSIMSSVVDFCSTLFPSDYVSDTHIDYFLCNLLIVFGGVRVPGGSDYSWGDSSCVEGNG